MDQRDTVTVSLVHVYYVMKAFQTGHRISCGKDAMVMIMIIALKGAIRDF